MKNSLALFGTATLCLLFAERSLAECHAPSWVMVGKTRITTEAATTVKQRETGLMHRKNLPANHGMWFDFIMPQRIAMWMKDTLIPLDMLFIDEAMVIKHIEHNATPQDETPRYAPSPIRYVLEVPGGTARKHFILPGQSITCGDTAP